MFYYQEDRVKALKVVGTCFIGVGIATMLAGSLGVFNDGTINLPTVFVGLSCVLGGYCIPRLWI